MDEAIKKLSYSIKDPMRRRKLRVANGDMIIALIPIIVIGCYYYGFRVLSLCVTTAIVTWILDIILCKFRKVRYDFKDLSPVVMSLVITLLLPASVPFWLPILACFLGLAVAKYPFGGSDSYIFSPAAFGFGAVALSFPELVFRYPTPFETLPIFGDASVELVSSAAGALKLGGVPTVDKFDMLLGNMPGAMGSSYIFVIIACGMFLLLRKAADYKVVLPYFATIALFVVVFQRIPGGAGESLFYELFSGSIVFCGVFLAGDITATPGRGLAKVAYGVMLAVVTMIFRYYSTPNVEQGFCFAFLLCNAFTPLLDNLAYRVTTKIKGVKIRA